MPKIDFAAMDRLEQRIKERYYDPSTHTPYKSGLDNHDWVQKNAELYEEFKKDLYEAYGVVDHPKAGRVFAMAWDRGHADGWYAVNNEFSELVELISD